MEDINKEINDEFDGTVESLMWVLNRIDPRANVLGRGTHEAPCSVGLSYVWKSDDYECDYEYDYEQISDLGPEQVNKFGVYRTNSHGKECYLTLIFSAM